MCGMWQNPHRGQGNHFEREKTSIFFADEFLQQERRLSLIFLDKRVCFGMQHVCEYKDLSTRSSKLQWSVKLRLFSLFQSS